MNEVWSFCVLSVTPSEKLRKTPGRFNSSRLVPRIYGTWGLSVLTQAHQKDVRSIGPALRRGIPRNYSETNRHHSQAFVFADTPLLLDNNQKARTPMTCISPFAARATGGPRLLRFISRRAWVQTPVRSL